MKQFVKLYTRTFATLNNNKHSPNVLVLVADGSEEIETVTIVDVLRRAGTLVELAKVDKELHLPNNKPDALTCTMSRGIKLVADSHFSQGHQMVEYDAVILPGGLKGSQTFAEHPILVNMLKHRVAEKKLVGAICASPATVLARHGLLMNVKEAVCHPSLLDTLESDVK